MIGGIESAAPALSGFMVKKRGRPSTKTQIEEAIPGQAERLKRLRTAHGFPTSSGFAAFLEISNNRYNGFENGLPLSREVAFLIVKKIPGLSLDWLYFGRSEALPLELARRLGELTPPGKRTTA